MTSTFASKLDGIATGAQPGTVTSVTATGPIVSSGGTTPVISIPAATSSVSGHMTTTQVSKLDGIASGAQPGTVTSVATGNGLTGGTITSTGTLTMSGSYTGAFAVTGALTATGDITAGFSDRRLKTNIKPIEFALAKVNSLNGIAYTPNDLAETFGHNKNENIVGLFADEVESILPEAVKLAPFDIGENGASKSGENYKAIQYEKLVPLLIEAIKELNSEIEELKRK